MCKQQSNPELYTVSGRNESQVGNLSHFYVFQMTSYEVHPLRQTNDLRQFPKGMIIYKHLLAVMMIQSRTVVNAFLSSAKLLTLVECELAFPLSVIDSENLPAVLRQSRMIRSLFTGIDKHIG